MSHTANPASHAADTIVLERTYRAGIDEMWALWTTKDGFESWWGPEGFRVEVHRIEPWAGGSLEYDMIADAAEAITAMQRMNQPVSHATHGTFTEVRQHERLVITHLIDFLAGVTPYESRAIAEFFVDGDEVRMVITLGRMHDAHWTQMATMGWQSQLTKLDKRFA